jgi:hypothetical protein
MPRTWRGVGSIFGSWYPEGKGPLPQEPSTFASASNIFPCRGKSPLVVQRKRRHPQDGNHTLSYRGGGLANCPRVLQREREMTVEKI